MQRKRLHRNRFIICQKMEDGKPSGKIHRVVGAFMDDDRAVSDLKEMGFSFVESADIPHWEGTIDGETERIWATIEPRDSTLKGKALEDAVSSGAVLS